MHKTRRQCNCLYGKCHGNKNKRTGGDGAKGSSFACACLGSGDRALAMCAKRKRLKRARELFDEAHERHLGSDLGLALALVMRIALLFLIGWLVTLQTPLFDLGLVGPPTEHGGPSFEAAFSGRDLILIAGGLFLLWKATKEIHHNVDPHGGDDVLDKKSAVTMSFGSAIVQIILLDMIFSLDSILTAVGMTDNLAVMYIAVIVAVTVMLIAADPLANFIARNPTVVIILSMCHRSAPTFWAILMPSPVQCSPFVVGRWSRSGRYFASRESEPKSAPKPPARSILREG